MSNIAPRAASGPRTSKQQHYALGGSCSGCFALLSPLPRKHAIFYFIFLGNPSPKASPTFLYADSRQNSLLSPNFHSPPPPSCSATGPFCPPSVLHVHEQKPRRHKTKGQGGAQREGWEQGWHCMVPGELQTAMGLTWQVLLQPSPDPLPAEKTSDSSHLPPSAVTHPSDTLPCWDG